MQQLALFQPELVAEVQDLVQNLEPGEPIVVPAAAVLYTRPGWLAQEHCSILFPGHSLPERLEMPGIGLESKMVSAVDRSMSFEQTGFVVVNLPVDLCFGTREFAADYGEYFRPERQRGKNYPG